MELGNYLKNLLHQFGLSNTYMEVISQDGQSFLRYTVFDMFFGNLERLYLPKGKDDAHRFIFSYWWFLKYENEYALEMRLDSPLSIQSDFKIFYHEDCLDISSMKSFSFIKTEEVEDVDSLNLERTYLILKQCLKYFLEEQNKRYSDLCKLQSAYNSLEKEYIQKYNQYYKIEDTSSEIEELNVVENVDVDAILDYFESGFRAISLKDYEKCAEFLKTLLDYIRKTEENEMDLLNQYYLVQIPKDMDLLKEKINLLEQALSKSFRALRKKADVAKLLEQMDQAKKDEGENVNAFLTSKKEFIEGSYALYLQSDIFSMGDALVTGKQLPIDLPIKHVIIPKEKEYFFGKEALEALKEAYGTLSSSLQEAHLAFHSFLRPYFLLTSFESPQVKENIRHLLSVFDKKKDSKILKKFPNLHTESIHSFITSILNYKKWISDSILSIPGELLAFTYDSLESQKNFLPVSFDANVAYLKENKEERQILKVGKNQKLSFAPEQILYDEYDEDFYVIPSFVGSLIGPLQFSKSDVILKVLKVSRDNEILVEDKIEEYPLTLVERVAYEEKI